MNEPAKRTTTSTELVENLNEILNRRREDVSRLLEGSLPHLEAFVASEKLPTAAGILLVAVFAAKATQIAEQNGLPRELFFNIVNGIANEFDEEEDVTRSERPAT